MLSAMLRRLFETLILPPASVLVLFLLGTALVRWRRRLGRTLQVTAIAWLLLASMPCVGGLLLHSLQSHPKFDLKAGDQGAEAIVVLSAGADLEALAEGSSAALAALASLAPPASAAPRTSGASHAHQSFSQGWRRALRRGFRADGACGPRDQRTAPRRRPTINTCRCTTASARGRSCGRERRSALCCDSFSRPRSDSSSGTTS